MRIIIIILTIGLFSCGQKQSDKWQVLDFGIFTLKTPSGWTVIEAHGIDSYVGGLTNGQDTLYFDYGWYSPSIGDEDPTKHKLAIDTVNGLLANIVIPIIDGKGEIGMSISKFKDEQNKFIIIGTNIKGTEKILQIFKSIKFAESDTTKNSPLTLSKFSKKPIGSGQTLFNMNCAACHARNKSVLGPSLGDIKFRRTFEWTYNFIKSKKFRNEETGVINSKSQNEINCPVFPKLSKEELKLIIDYIN